MRVAFLLILLLAVLGGGTAYVVRVYLPQHPEFSEQAVERGLEIAAKLGWKNLGDSIDQNLGLCRVFAAPPASDRGMMIVSELRLESSAPLPFGRPVLTAGQSILCLWPKREKTILFSTDTATELTVLRKKDEPPLVALRAGNLAISSESLWVALRLPSYRLNLSSSAPARVNAQLIEGAFHITALKGTTEVKLETQEASAGGWVPTVLTVAGGTFRLNGTPMEKNEEASVLPSGIEVRKTAPAKEAPPAPTGEVPR